MSAGAFAAVGIALYVGHHVGDYWVQTNGQAEGKGKQGHEGRIACIEHCATYSATQLFMLGVTMLVTGLYVPWWQMLLGIAVSGVTHYFIDRREYGLMFKLARRLGKSNFMKLGVPRAAQVVKFYDPEQDVTITDNPSLGTGAWALDQSAHLFFGVFVAALVMCA